MKPIENPPPNENLIEAFREHQENTIQDSWTLEIETELEQESNRWIADIPSIPGVVVYGSSGANKDEAIAYVKALAFEIIADRIRHNEEFQHIRTISFVMSESLPDPSPEFN